MVEYKKNENKLSKRKTIIEPFEYSSKNNKNFLNIEGIKKLIAKT